MYVPKRWKRKSKKEVGTSVVDTIRSSNNSFLDCRYVYVIDKIVKDNYMLEILIACYCKRD